MWLCVENSSRGAVRRAQAARRSHGAAQHWRGKGGAAQHWLCVACATFCYLAACCNGRQDSQRARGLGVSS